MDVIGVARIRLRLGEHNLPDTRRHQMGVIRARDLGRPQRHTLAGCLVEPSLAGVAARQVAAHPDHGQQDQGDASGGIVSISALGRDMVQDLAQLRKRVCLFAEMHLFFCKTRLYTSVTCCRRSRCTAQRNSPLKKNKLKRVKIVKRVEMKE